MTPILTCGLKVSEHVGAAFNGQPYTSGARLHRSEPAAGVSEGRRTRFEHILKSVKVAVIGVGRIGFLHATLLRQMPEVEQLYVADLDRARASAAARELEVDEVADPVEAIERSDRVIVATPPDSHATLVAAAVHRERPVLCEKPLASDAAEAADLAADVESTGVPVMVGFQRRFDPVMTVARQLVTSGNLGVIQLIRLESTEPTMGRSNKTNLLRNTAIHDFDLVRWLSGCEAISVHAVGSDRDRGIFDPSRDPDSVVVTIRLTDGSLCSISTSRLSPHGYDVRAELLGSLDHVAAGWTERTPVRSLETGIENGLPKAWQSWQERFEEAFRRELRAFVAADQDEAKAVAATVRDGVAAQRIAEAARRSLTGGQTVFL